MPGEMVSINDFEQRVLELEQVRIVIRAPVGARVPAYPYTRQAAGSAQVNEWLEARVRPLTGDQQVIVIDGSGVHPHGRTKMETLRSSYSS